MNDCPDLLGVQKSNLITLNYYNWLTGEIYDTFLRKALMMIVIMSKQITDKLLLVWNLNVSFVLVRLAEWISFDYL